MAGSIGEVMANRPFAVRMANIGIDMIRTLNYRDNEKRASSFRACAIEQMDYIIEHEKKQSYIRECERLKELFLDLFEEQRKYDVSDDDIISYLNTYILMNGR